MVNFSEIEAEILKFWEKNKIFENLLKKKPNTPSFVFYEGPPFANAKPGIHHVLVRSFKDIVIRYKTMNGYFVTRKAGWDTHGLPVEMQVEKKLGITSKPEIEKLGIEKFIKLCKENVFTYKKQWEKMTKRMGFWLDFKNAYITCDNHYIESLWWILKRIWQKGLIYKDWKVMPYCPRCGTSLSDHEVAQGYKDVEDPSIYLKFKVKSNHPLFMNSYFLVWTTTPWTLPANTALAINPNADYVLVKQNNESLILAKKRLSVLDDKYKLIEEFKGLKLKGLSYEPLFKFSKPEGKMHIVVPADFVSLDEGTGIVHIAPAFGLEDLELAKKEHLAVILNVDEQGRFKNEVEPYAGRFVKEADPSIIFDLEKRNLLYKKETIKHSYPFCWRCDTPLLYYAKDSWYIKTTAVVAKMLDENKKINWHPSYIKHGRFGNWLKENIDWAISRERYWGTPLPIWVCNCGNLKFIGSLKELKHSSINPLDEKTIDLHRPYVDFIYLKCEKCGKKMSRVPDVIDCWFDSGSMPFAQNHWPFEQVKNKNVDGLSDKDIKNLIKLIPFPADFIAEGIDQTRGWFYTLLAVSTLLGFGAPFKNVICLGLVLDEKGKKMSKSKGNVVYPEDVFEKYGADAARMYFYLNPIGETIRFSEKEIQEVFRKFILTLYNCLIFYKTYRPFVQNETNNHPLSILDQWINSRLNDLILNIRNLLESYEINKAARLLYEFVLEDLSNWYIRRSRKRKGSLFFNHFKKVLEIVALISAPFVPFIAEKIWLELGNKESVHLQKFPYADKKLIDKDLNKKMDLLRTICSQVLEIRAKLKLKVRQPLNLLEIENANLKDKRLLELMADELNLKQVKEVSKIKPKKGFIIGGEKIKFALDTKISTKLLEEGIVRELIRIIQDLRKKHSLRPKDLAYIFYDTNDSKLLDILSRYNKVIKEQTNSKQIIKQKLNQPQMEINGRKIKIQVKK